MATTFGSRFPAATENEELEDSLGEVLHHDYGYPVPIDAESSVFEDEGEQTQAIHTGCSSSMGRKNERNVSRREAFVVNGQVAKILSPIFVASTMEASNRHSGSTRRVKARLERKRQHCYWLAR